jgi:hypothetical protein
MAHKKEQIVIPTCGPYAMTGDIDFIEQNRFVVGVNRRLTFSGEMPMTLNRILNVGDASSKIVRNPGSNNGLETAKLPHLKSGAICCQGTFSKHPRA